jgi:hypothetical protein
MGLLREAIVASTRVSGFRDDLAGLPIEPLGEGERGPGIAWVPVRSVWIAALRWVPIGRRSPTAYLAEGYIDMLVHYQNRAYRYGPGISQRQFNTWRVAASRGKYWWRYFTRRWSPARRIA